MSKLVVPSSWVKLGICVCMLVFSFWSLFDRHLYKPMLARGYSRVHANISVFIVSAIFHEVCLSLLIKSLAVLAFTEGKI